MITLFNKLYKNLTTKHMDIRMDIRGTWISKHTDVNQPSKSITIVDVLPDGTGIGPDGVKIEHSTLLANYERSDPFSMANMSSEFKDLVNKEDVIATSIEKPEQNLSEQVKETTYHIVNVDESPEKKLYTAMLLIGTEPSVININSEINLPIDVNLIKSLAMSMATLNKEKFIRLMIEDASSELLDNIASAIFKKISE